MKQPFRSIQGPALRPLSTFTPIFNFTLTFTFAIACAFAIAAAAPAFAATRTVTTTADAGPGSLRQTIGSSSSGDTLVFALPALPATITLTSGQLEIFQKLQVVGPGPGLLEIDAGGLSRVAIVNGVEATFEGLRFTGGRATKGGALAVQNTGGKLILRDCEVVGNTAIGNPAFGDNARGGGIFVSNAELVLERCLIAGNNAEGPVDSNGSGRAGVGGGLATEASGAVTIRDCFFRENDAIGGNVSAGGGTGGVALGGGLLISGGPGAVTIIERSTFRGNRALGGSSAAAAGGEALGGAAAIDSLAPGSAFRFSTLAGNVAVGGQGATRGGATAGGVWGNNARAFENLTVTGNQASSTLSARGGGLVLQATTLAQSIVSGNLATLGLDVEAVGAGVPSLGYNLVSAPPVGNFGTLPTDDVGNGTNPLLGTLRDNGGYTATRALLAGSPAIDAVPPGQCGGAADQRGVARPQAAGCDIGAFEVIPVLFADGFESGNTGNWSLAVP